MKCINCSEFKSYRQQDSLLEKPTHWAEWGWCKRHRKTVKESDRDCKATAMPEEERNDEAYVFAI